MRLNEKEEDYQHSLKKLKEKCIKSEFNKTIVENTINITSKWKKETYNENKNKELQEKKKINWSTKFKSLLKLNPTERKIAPNSQITFSRPPTIGTLLTNYRKTTQETDNKCGESTKCGKCGLCGNYAKMNNMVLETKKIKTKNGTKIRLKQRLNCRSYGVYAAKCNYCEDYYVGQTVNKFSVRWNGHRRVWNELSKQNEGQHHDEDAGTQKDEQALYIHYRKNHPNVLRGLRLDQAYQVIFVESPPKHDLDVTESFWINKLQADINIAKTILPKIR